MSCGVGHRHGLDLAWLWPAATAPIRPLVWELTYATSVALKKKKSMHFTLYEGLPLKDLTYIFAGFFLGGVFLKGPHLRHMEVPSLGVQLEL